MKKKFERKKNLRDLNSDLRRATHDFTSESAGAVWISSIFTVQICGVDYLLALDSVEI